MATRRILLLDANQLTAFAWQRDGARLEARFTPDDAGYAAFGEYLRSRRGSLFLLLADVAEEGFQVEQLPHVLGGDRRELIQRKLSQLFYGTPLSMAVSLGRMKDGRRDERFLFAGLTGHALFEPWLQATRLAEASIAGIYSMPQVIAGLLGKPSKAQEPALVISLSSAGLRQTFFESGQMRFSRLAPMAIGRIDEVATACASETNKIYQYLAGQRLIARDVPLRTLVLAHPGQFNAFSARYQDTPERRVEFLDLVALARKHGLEHAPADSNAEPLALHLLVRQQPKQQFAPDQDRRYFRLRQARFGVNAAAGAVLAGSVAFAVLQALQLNKQTSESEGIRTDIELSKRRYDAMLQGLPKVPIAMDDLRTLTDREALLVKRSPGPEPLYQHISRALAKAPRVELSKLNWRLTGNPDDDAPVGAQAASTPRATGAAGATVASYTVVDLHAQLPASMAVDHRSQLETVDAFVAALSTGNVKVKVVSLPFETESGKSIRSGEAASEAEPPRFVLRMVQSL